MAGRGEGVECGMAPVGGRGGRGRGLSEGLPQIALVNVCSF